MCGPVDRCCCCYPAHIGVRFIAAFLTILELGGLIYNAIILAENNKSFVLTIGDDMPHYNAYMAGIICGYIVIIAANLILIYGWLFVPWLFINMILVIACGVGALTLFVWFSFVQPVLLPAVLSVVPLVCGAVLLYWWVIVNGVFISMGLGEIRSILSNEYV